METIKTEEEIDFPEVPKEGIALRELEHLHSKCKTVKEGCNILKRRLDITQQMCEDLESAIMEILEPIMLHQQQVEEAQREADPHRYDYKDAEPGYEDGSSPSISKDDVPFNEDDTEYTDDEPIFAEDNKAEKERQQEL